ncbi:HU family DNA-binding protein [Deinococcus sonorensis]|uniref:HU family DNA-binding protein n=2 Tax=Deinococcus sonorensis TaxID=309891 RepID=A0AAU7UFH8_9DEIO
MTRRKNDTVPKSTAPAPAAEVGDAGKLGKALLVEQVTEATGLTRQQSDAAVSAALQVIVDALSSGKTVGLPGLGTLSVKTTAERQGVRPGTSERITIPAGRKVAFKVASTLKASL